MSPASMCQQHDQDLYRGDARKPGICTRIEQLEGKHDMISNDLYDEESGIVPAMRNFLAVNKDRKAQSDRRMTTYTIVIAAAAIAAAPIWDTVKHALGWLK